MWIMTQNKQSIINSDNITDIFIPENGVSIVGRTPQDLLQLGRYKDKETCYKVLETFFKNSANFKYVTFPPEEDADVERWLQECNRYIT